MSDMLQLVVEDRMRPQINTNETDRMANSLSDPSHLFLSVATIVSASKDKLKHIRQLKHLGQFNRSEQ